MRPVSAGHPLGYILNKNVHAPTASDLTATASADSVQLSNGRVPSASPKAEKGQASNGEHRVSSAIIGHLVGGPLGLAVASSVPAADATAEKPLAPLRDAAFAVNFSDRFNKDLHLRPSELADKVALMRQDPHKFFRCMPALFYEDVLGQYRDKSQLLERPAPKVQLAGDLHLGNVGTFRDANDNAAWGINDFDMTMKGPVEWDLERCAASIVLAARGAGLDKATQKKLVADFAHAYFHHIKQIAEGKDSGPASLTEAEASGPVKSLIHDASLVTRKEFMKKYIAADADGKLRFLTGKHDIRAVTPQVADAVRKGVEGYDKRQGPTPHMARPIQILDVAEKFGSGGSSYGMYRYYVLVANAKPGHEPLILEVKQELASPLVDRTGDPNKADAKAVVEGETAMGGTPNPCTGHTTVDGYSYLVREREPQKSAIDPATVKSPSEFQSLVEQVAWVAARGHGQKHANAQAIVDWVGDDKDKAIQNVLDFAETYANQTDADWKSFKANHAE